MLPTNISRDYSLTRPFWIIVIVKIPLMSLTDNPYNKMGDFIKHDKNPIIFLYRRPIKAHCHHISNEKERIFMAEHLN